MLNTLATNARFSFEFPATTSSGRTYLWADESVSQLDLSAYPSLLRRLKRALISRVERCALGDAKLVRLPQHRSGALLQVRLRTPRPASAARRARRPAPFKPDLTQRF